MLTKRSRSPQKDQTSSNLMRDRISESCIKNNISNQKYKSSSFLNVPGLFVGLNPWSGDSYSVRSPTSPLDFRVFSSFGNPFRSPKSPTNEEQKKSFWDRSKVGLSIIDSLEDPTKPSEKLSHFPPGNKNVVFGPKMIVASSKSLPKHISAPKNTCGVVFEIGDGNLRARSLDSSECGAHKSRFVSPNPVPENNPTEPITSSPTSTNRRSVIVGSISAGDIENSEDYTRVITRGPNPKVTHIFAGVQLQRVNGVRGETRNPEPRRFLEMLLLLPEETRRRGESILQPRLPREGDRGRRRSFAHLRAVFFSSCNALCGLRGTFHSTVGGFCFISPHGIVIIIITVSF